ncbi:MAG: hypothetical protein ACYDAE_21625 [Steroidobacteraceae bacterium]
MAQFSAGLTDALNSMQNRAYQQAEIDKIRQAVTFSNLKQQLEEQEREKQQRAQAQAVESYGQLSAPPESPQPPPPGQPSVPMQQAQVPPPMGGGGMGLPPPPMPGGPAPAAGMGGMAAPQPAGWRPSPSAPPSLGGAPPGPQGGAPGALAPPPGGAQQQSIIPNQPDWAAKTIETLTKKGLPPQEIYRVLEAMAPIRDAHNKEVMQTYMIEMKAAQAGELAARAEKERLQGELAGKPKPETPTGFQKEAADLYGKDTPGYRKAMEKHIARMDRMPGTTVNVGGGLTDDAKRLAAEQYLATGQLPAMYRDQKGRAAIMDLAAQIQKERGGDVADVPGARAGFKADASSLQQRQRFVDAGNQFIKNMVKQADLVDSLMTKGTASGVPVINKWIQAGRKGLTGDPDVTALDTAIRGLAREHQRIVTGVTSNAQLHVAAQQTADELLNIAQTPKQMRAAIKVMREEAKNAVDAGNAEVAEIRTRMRGSTGAAAPSTKYIETRKTADGRTLGKKADGTIEEVK